LQNRQPSYEIDCTLEHEIPYLSWQIRQFDELRAYDYRVPPSLKDEVERVRRLFISDELREAIIDDSEPGQSIEELRNEWNSQADQLHHAFFGRLLRHLPPSINVHVTKYGPGGSYRRDGFRGRPGEWAISIKNPRFARFSWTFNQIIVHETVELLIDRQVLTRGTAPKAKEAIVDQFCSCAELQAVYGTYPKQSERVAGPLPSDWASYLNWQEGMLPTWD
jgi:hypothetical protein